MVRPIPDMATPEFVATMLRTPFCQRQMTHHSKQTAQANLFLGRMGEIRLPVSPIIEQRAMVAKVNGFLQRLGAIRGVQRDTSAELNALLPSILDRAFRGEL